MKEILILNIFFQFLKANYSEHSEQLLHVIIVIGIKLLCLVFKFDSQTLFDRQKVYFNQRR